MHAARRAEGELSSARLSELWMASQKAMFGDSVTMRDDYGMWWSYVPHFLNTPGYVYAYAFGELDRVSIKIPTGYTLESVPKAQDARLSYAAYQNVVEFDGKQLTTQRILQVNGIFFRVELYPEVKDFFSKVQAGDEQQAVLSGGSTNAQKGN